MKKKVWPTVPAEERLQLLKDQCDDVEHREYLAQLTESELVEMREELAENSIDVAAINADKAEAIKEFNEELKPLKDRNAEIIEALRLKGEKRKEDLYKIIDHEAGEVGYYNGKGYLVDFRKQRPDERQTRIRAINQ